MIIPVQTLGKKMFLLTTGMVIGVACIIARLSYLQINLGSTLLNKSKNNFLRYEHTNCLRGNIVDTNGKLLATNRPVINIYWKGTGNKKLSEQQIKAAHDLFDVLALEESDTLITTIERAEKKAQRAIVAKDIDFTQLSKIAEGFSLQQNIVIETDFARLYPYKSLASHALGYLGTMDIDAGGKMGLEKFYESLLQGKKGVTQKVLNSFGKHLAEKEVEQSFAGQDINITLDLSLQRIAEMLFPKDRRGAFILMDSSDGSLRVALSRPHFDPNIFLGKMDHATWLDIQERKPFLNRVFHATYPPGSLFKLITLAAALEQGIIEEDTEWDCTGSVSIGRYKFRCHKKDGHGPLSAAESIAKSCNIMFYEIGKKLDIDILSRYARSFGLGRTIKSVFNDLPGLIPSREWKAKTKGERWWLGETLSATIGQTYLLTTPVQIARMLAGIETGYLVSPRILEDSSILYEPLSISYKTRTFLQKTMQAVAQEGTAKTLNKLEDFTIHAKTSTAQTSLLSKRKLGEQFLEHGWFTANFRYKDNPPMTMVIVIENAGNARLSLIVAKAFMKAYKNLIDTRKQKNG